MNITFTIHDKTSMQFDHRSLIQKPIRITRITTNSNNYNTYGLVLNQINNSRMSYNQSKQSPILWINPGYNIEIVDIVVPPSVKWDFILIDTSEQNVSTEYDIQVNIISDTVSDLVNEQAN